MQIAKHCIELDGGRQAGRGQAGKERGRMEVGCREQGEGGREGSREGER